MAAKTDYLLINSLFLLLIIHTPPIQAELYKWVDKDGNVNYTQSPPPAGIRATKIKPPPAALDNATVERLQRQQAVLGELSEQRRSEAEQQQKGASEQEQKQGLCAQARSTMAGYNRPRVSITSADGTRRALGEDERLQGLERARKQVEELCAK